MICLCSETYCRYDSQSSKIKFSSKALINGTPEDYCDRPMSKYRKVLEGVVIVTSTNWGSRTIQHAVAIYDQTKKGLSYRCPRRKLGNTLIRLI